MPNKNSVFIRKVDDPAEKFHPSPIIIVRGETIEWINNDDKVHTIIAIQQDEPNDLFNTKAIKPNEKADTQLKVLSERVDYCCSLHPEEKGWISIADKPVDEMTQTEYYRFLSNSNNIEPPPILSHLDSPKRIAREKILGDIDKYKTEIVKYFDPIIFDTLLQPEEYEIKSKFLSIVFWDISSFSNLCNDLLNSPFLIKIFLQKYFNLANKLIHEHNGIIDKFIGDGIMAYFGIQNKNNGANDALNAALQLRDDFSSIKTYFYKLIDENRIKVDKEIDIKCGIHTGDVLFGLIQTDYRDQITIIGSNVNYASRLEGLAMENQIIVSKDTLKYIANNYNASKKYVDIQSYGKSEVYIL